MIKHVQMVLYIVLVLGVVALFSQLMSTEQAATLSELEFVTYDDVLYTPEQLHGLTDEQRAAGHVGWDYDYYDEEFSRVRTNQIVLHLTPGETYGLYTEQLTYAANLWVDGHQMVKMGTVSDSPEGFEPRTGSAVVYFTAGDETEIVMQRSNFCHAKWNAVLMYLGTQDVITRQVQARFFTETIHLGFLGTLAIVNIGMFAGMPSRRRYLWFSLGSFFAMIHHSLLDPKAIMLVLPTLNWYVSYKTEEISLLAMMTFLMLFMRDVFGRSPWKWVDYAIFGIVGAMAAGILILPTSLYTRYTVPMGTLIAACAVVYCTLLLAKTLRNWGGLQISQKYYLVGLLVFIVNGVLSLLGIGPAHMNQIRAGFVLFELTTTVALALELLDVQRAFQESKQMEEQLRAMNESMEQMRALQDNFMALVNHEMRTPLTVIAGYADLSARQLEAAEQRDETMIRNLRIMKSEALRLGRIVEKSDEGARSMVANESMATVPVRSLFEDARDFCLPICEKRRNGIEIACPADLAVRCMRDNMLQVLYNLVLNASRHTSNGTIRLVGEQREAEVVLSVEDDGEGMDENVRQHAFERGYTKDGRQGLGLALCREVVECHQGRIWIDDGPSGGVAVRAALPATVL